MQHGYYRLGDCKNYKDQLLFNKIENLNFKVGAISPMNLANDLKNPSYFIPDPGLILPLTIHFGVRK